MRRKFTAAVSGCGGVRIVLRRDIRLLRTGTFENTVEMRNDDLERYSKVNSMEIHGIPRPENEDVVVVVKEVGKALNVEILNLMIDACYRVGQRSVPNNPEFNCKIDG
ncbi:hypothetical protein J6590_019583 [Homalodisca vitripennis]|nr:hypothetical protein J6590_019583 [Homalodisca vitripennis]